MNSDMHVDTLMFHTLNLELSPSTDSSHPPPSAMDCSSFNAMNQQGLLGDSVPESAEEASSGDRFAFYDCHEDFMSAGISIPGSLEPVLPASLPSAPEFTMQPESAETLQGSQVAAWRVSNYAHL
ncbi:hypothetical protein BGZ52_008458, partial [Haplosporangium bisporale]